eukprot:5709629-Heterocapsa_arctica.AAC.1
MLEHVFETRNWSQAYVVQNYKRSARNLMVMARMPEDRSKTFKTIQTPSKTFKAIYPCSPVAL